MYKSAKGTLWQTFQSYRSSLHMYTWRHNRVLAILADLTETHCRVANRQPTQDPNPGLSFPKTERPHLDMSANCNGGYFSETSLRSRIPPARPRDPVIHIKPQAPKARGYCCRCLIRIQVRNKEQSLSPEPRLNGECWDTVTKPQGQKFLAASRDWKMAAHLKEAFHFPYRAYSWTIRHCDMVWHSQAHHYCLTDCTLVW